MKRLIFFALLTLPAAPPAGAQDWQFSSSVNYDTGKYGTSYRTDAVYIPLTLKRYYRYGDVSVTASWLRQSTTGQTTRVNGTPVRVHGGSAAPTSSQSGPGDLLVRGTLDLKTEKLDSYDLALAGLLKLPTADKSKGLGTGQMDQGFGLEFAKNIAGRWTLLLDGYYTIVGEPQGMDYNSQLALAAGFHKTVGEGFGLTMLYETRSALVAGSPDPRDVFAQLSYDWPNGLRYAGGLTLGLSEGSPDLGLSAAVSRKF